MTNPDAGRDYLHFQWTMPHGIPGGPVEPLEFSIIAAEMVLKDAPVFVEGLRGVIDDRNLSILGQAVHNLLAEPNHGPEQPHVIAFTSARTPDLIILQAGAMVLFNLLERRWPGKTLSLIPIPWTLFETIEKVATKGGFWPTPPPSRN